MKQIIVKFNRFSFCRQPQTELCGPSHEPEKRVFSDVKLMARVVVRFQPYICGLAQKKQTTMSP